MNNDNFLKTLEERPLRMAIEPELRRPEIVLRRNTTPVETPESPLSAIVILGLAFWLVYAVVQTMPA